MGCTTISSRTSASATCASAANCWSGRRFTATATERPRLPVEDLLRRGRDVLFDIDYQGTQQIVAKARDDVATVFILPPSMRELRARLERRAEDKRRGHRAQARSCAQRNHAVEALRLRPGQRRPSDDVRRCPGDPGRGASAPRPHRGGRGGLRGPFSGRDTDGGRGPHRLERSSEFHECRDVERFGALRAVDMGLLQQGLATSTGRSIRCSERSDCRSILRLCPKAAAATSARAEPEQARGVGAGHEFDHGGDYLGRRHKGGRAICRTGSGPASASRKAPPAGHNRPARPGSRRCARPPRAGT